MRETILASNLIRKLNFMRSAALAICLGLLPSQVFATTQTCEAYPDCADLGYTQTICDKYSISLRCPFDNSKLFCSECDRTYSVKDTDNNVCVDGKIYCANLGQPFDKGECGSCATGNLFNKSIYACEDGVKYCARSSKIYDSSKNECKSCACNQAFVSTSKTCKENINFSASIKSSSSNSDIASRWVSIEFTNEATGDTSIFATAIPSGGGQQTGGVCIKTQGAYIFSVTYTFKDHDGKEITRFSGGRTLTVNGRTGSAPLKPNEFITIVYTEGMAER